MIDELKIGITNKFDKKAFHLVDHNTGETGSLDCIDENLREFIGKLNECPHIMTRFSCEGHQDGGVGYISFQVNPEGWDIFWQKVMPALSWCFCSVNPQTPSDIRSQLWWHVSVKDNQHGAGISLYAQFSTIPSHEELGMKEVSWETRKWRFWDVVKSVFLEHFIVE